jgi:cytochrome c553
MRLLTKLAVVSTLACGGCHGKSAASMPPPASAPSSLAAPIVAPMAARERLLHDLDAQKRAANVRQQEFDAATDTGH